MAFSVASNCSIKIICLINVNNIFFGLIEDICQSAWYWWMVQRQSLTGKVTAVIPGQSRLNHSTCYSATVAIDKHITGVISCTNLLVWTWPVVAGASGLLQYCFHSFPDLEVPQSPCMRHMRRGPEAYMARISHSYPYSSFPYVRPQPELGCRAPFYGDIS